jgi:hypothetical protein
MRTQQEYEYYLQRTEESTYDLYETVTKLPKIMISKIIDWTVFIIASYYIIQLTADFDYSWAAFAVLFILLAFVGFNILKLLTRGVSIGQFIMGIRYISIRSKEPITSVEYAKYLIENLNAPVKYKQLLSYYFSYNNRLLQNVPMKRYGFIIVDRPKYKAFIKEYKYNQKKLQELKQQLA